MTTPLPESAARVQEHLEAQGCEARVVVLPAGTHTAADAARAIGCDAAGTPTAVVSLTPAELVRLTGGRVADVAR